MLGVARQTLSFCGTRWESQMQKMADVVSGWIPPGWDATSSSANFLENTPVLMALVLNPFYSKLHPGTDMLGGMLTRVRTIQKDGCGMLVHAEVLSSSLKVHQQATDTLLYAYVVLLITQKIPSGPSAAGRKKLIKGLKIELGARFKKLSAPVQKRFADIDEGKEFEAMNYSQLRLAAQAAPEAAAAPAPAAP